MFSARTIVCPVDFSPGSDAAVAHGIDLATTYGGAIHLVHVHPIDIFVSPDGGMVVTPDTLARITAATNQSLETVAARCRAAGLVATCHVRNGAAADEVVRLAHEVKADLVVAGTHGRTGVARFFLGSVAERIVRLCPVPVLTVRMPKHEADSPT